ncbi:MAG: FemAB family XrtA/PEP-CTERM system-associated protein [Pirellulaceae bacterium]
MFLERLVGHDPAWLAATAQGLGHRSHLLETRNSFGELTGQLPLVEVATPWFGRFLVSLPYINTGGIWAHTPEAARDLLGQAIELADQRQVRYLELRHEKPLDDPRLNVSRTDKVHMRLSLPDSTEKLLKQFRSELRSQIKRSQHEQFGSQASFGREELLEPFYEVFSTNMRDLGTPVFGKRLFLSILRNFPETSEFCVVRQKNVPVAAALLIHHASGTEVPSASSLRAYNATQCNMFLYWNLLSRAVERNSPLFDFGRSSVDSGTFKFKKQWGSIPAAAHWQYYLRRGSAEAMRPDQGANAKLVKIWQKLPLWVTRLAGPAIVRGIP